MNDWISCSTFLPENGKEVLTKIDDEHGRRNENVVLKRQGRLWFIPDMSMYVYYGPTHWKNLTDN